MPTTPAFGVPTGTIAVTVGSMPSLQETLAADGFVRGGLRIPALSVTMVIAYSGDAAYEGSASTATVTVGKAGTVIMLTAAPNPARIGEQVTFTALVDSLAPSMWWPSGLLTGTIDGQPVPGTVTLDGSGGSGQFGRAFTTPGLHRVTAGFAGDEDFTASEAALDVTVTALPGAPPRQTVTAARRLSVKAAPKRDVARPIAS